MTGPVHVIGASGRSGRALCAALAACGTPFVPVVRDPARWRSGGASVAPRITDLTDGPALATALHDATAIVSCAHARHVGAILAAAPAASRFVFLGSTRRFTRWPDAHGNGVIAGETALLASGRAGIMLHPTMIYGAEGEDNVQRLAALLRRLPVVPLPLGGRALVQPIHQSDVTRAIIAALDLLSPRSRTRAMTLVIAGPTPLPYADFVRAVARAAGLPPPRVVPIPALPLRLLTPLTRALPFVPIIRAGEIRRLTEDKAFDIAAMRDVLGIEPLSLEAGLRL